MMMADSDLAGMMADYAPDPPSRQPDVFCARCGIGPFFHVPERTHPELCIECGPTTTDKERQ